MAHPIEVSAKVNVAARAAREAFLRDPRRLLQDAQPSSSRTGTDALTIQVDVAAATSLAARATLTLGVPATTADGVAVPVAWRAAAHERLFPTFDGTLELGETPTGVTLRLRGGYTVPGGAIGALGDALVGHRSAHSALQRLVEEAASRLKSEVARSQLPVRTFPTPYPLLSAKDVPSDHLRMR